MLLAFLHESLSFSWQLYKQSAPFFLFGLVLAGLIKTFFSPGLIARHLGRRGLSSVLKAALIGIPLPLCSCSVLPVAASLKKQGANRGALAAFLISTPESGLDSIAISWAILDPIMTVARPLAAFITAAAAGLLQNLLGRSVQHRAFHPPVGVGSSSCDVTVAPATQGHCCSCSPCQEGVQVDSCDTSKPASPGFLGRIRSGLGYSFFELWWELSGWFFLGLLIAGVIAGLIPEGFFQGHLSGGILSMLFMLLLGIPVYICATASTPVAAALILKGMSPGTALVFLLAGPATNITSLSVLLGILGKRGTFIYLLTIALFSVMSGLILDRVYAILNISPVAVIGQAAQVVPGILMTISAVVLTVLFLYNLWNKKIRPRNLANNG